MVSVTAGFGAVEAGAVSRGASASTSRSGGVGVGLERSGSSGPGSPSGPGHGGFLVVGAAGGDQLDGPLRVVVGDRSAADQRAQVEHGQPIGHGEHVVEIVGDHEDGDAPLAQPAG